ncbi:hypothetical protein ACXN5S_02000 [Pseudoroseicyclus sp. H15]
MSEQAEGRPEVTAEPVSGGGKVDDELRHTLGRALRDQAQRQERLRHVQEFLSAPTFLDLSQLGADYSDPPEALEERWRDLDYRVTVLRSLLGMMEEEREMLGKLLERDAAPGTESATDVSAAFEDAGDDAVALGGDSPLTRATKSRSQP